MGNHNVAGSDIVEIRKLILGVIPNFTKVDPWAFIRTDYLSVITPNTTLKEIGFKGSNITLFPKQNIDVLVLKIGDVDFSYKGSNFQTDEADVRSQKMKCHLSIKFILMQIKQNLLIFRRKYSIDRRPTAFNQFSFCMENHQLPNC